MKNLLLAQRMNLPWVESPFFNELLVKKQLTREQVEQARQYHNDGFIIIKQAISHDLIDSIIKDIDNEYPNTIGKEPSRHQDIWKKYNSIKEVSAQKDILATLRFLYDREPIPFQTLNFKYGTQQRAHSDTIHFSSIPARFMCGVWTAFEDTHEQNGPLFYYPQSHRLEEYSYAEIGINKDHMDSKYSDYEDFIEDLMEAKGYQKQAVYLKKGDVMIWSSNLVHGGSPILGGNVTRWSQVTHYYFEDCIYYSPRFSEMYTNELNLRPIINIATGKPVHHSINGKPIETLNIGRADSGNRKYAVSPHLSAWVLLRGAVKKLLGQKPF